MGERPTVALSANNCWNLLHFSGTLLSRLQEAGFNVVALAPLDADAKELQSRGIEVLPVPISPSGMNPFAEARLLLRYIRLLRALKPAVYCGFTIKPNVYGAIAARLAGVPVINNITGLASPYISGGLVWAISERLYRFSFRRSHTVFVCNPEDLRICIERGIARPDQGRVIPGSGVNLERFRPDESSAANDSGPPILLFVGRIIAHKGVRELVEAARIIKSKMPAVRFQLLGSPDPGNPSCIGQDELQSWIDDGIVEHLGETTDVRPFMRAATAVVLPSYREGMSCTILEAAALGKPLVGSNVPGIRELVEEGVTGTVAEPRDAVSLAQAMERIAKASPAELRALGAAARDKVEREFGEEVVVRAYLDAVEGAMGAASIG